MSDGVGSMCGILDALSQTASMSKNCDVGIRLLRNSAGPERLRRGMCHELSNILTSDLLMLSLSHRGETRGDVRAAAVDDTARGMARRTVRLVVVVAMMVGGSEVCWSRRKPGAEGIPVP